MIYIPRKEGIRKGFKGDGDVVLDIVNMRLRDEDNILDQIYEKKCFWIFIIKFFIPYKYKRKAYLHKSRTNLNV